MVGSKFVKIKNFKKKMEMQQTFKLEMQKNKYHGLLQKVFAIF